MFVEEFKERDSLVGENFEYREHFKSLEIWEMQREVGYQGPKIVCVVGRDAYGG